MNARQAIRSTYYRQKQGWFYAWHLGYNDLIQWEEWQDKRAEIFANNGSDDLQKRTEIINAVAP